MRKVMTTNVSELNTLEFDKDGHLANLDDWTPEIAQELAYQEDVGELNDRHWVVINYIRNEFIEKGDAPSIRKLTKESGVSTKELYQLFPKGPAKKAAKVAGLPKPKGCI
ncbi:TusE/DsrC/DsvC family sulfur relay protein [Balneola sp. MJW-20]|uniref:TusE/DsrC/DsvC family sulfur relay protein n=1 Tax=Gracilimonas aurantiaca TaxID=3234185 RepID=UPI003909BD85